MVIIFNNLFLKERNFIMTTYNKILESKVWSTPIDKNIYKLFDLWRDHDQDVYVTRFEVPNLHDQLMSFDNGNPLEFNIGLIVGSSGSGKSSILKQFGEEEKPVWKENYSIASHFKDESDAIDRLSATGLNSVPTWAKPRDVVSNGEGFRADLARKLGDGAVVDEFTSVVNRNVAKSCSTSIAKYIRKNDIKNVVLASCHNDIIEWLEPDWVYNTDTKQLVSRRSLRQGRVRWVRPTVELSIYRCCREKWELFKNHHYLTAKLPTAVRCFLAKWNGETVGFASSMALPGRIPPLYEGDTRMKFRECRTVCLPDFQGLGIGTRLSDAVADIHIEQGLRYFSKTSHIRMGEYRQNSPLWRKTVTNLKDRSKSTHGDGKGWHHWTLEKKRICYSHEYIGPVVGPYNRYRKSYDPKYQNLYKRKDQKNG
tara:strand:- start:22668 stop:23942 length:1275 start_codon:yes stop_codon:yes gene_type:complete